MSQTYIDIKNSKVYSSIDGYVYSLDLDSNWLETVEELTEGGGRSVKPGVNVLGTSDQFEHIVNRLKRGI